MRRHLPLFKQVFLFGIVGVTTLLIDVVVTYACYHFLGLPAYLASAVGFFSGFAFNFPMNRKRVFHHSVNDRFTLTQQVAMYIALSVFNLLVTSLLVEFIVYVGIDIAIAKIIVTALIAVWNFLLFKFIVFSKKKKIETETT